MAYLLDILYLTALIATSPVWITKMIRHGRYRQHWRHRFGAIPRHHGLQPVIWIHGVSLGEVNAAKPLVEELHRQLPDYRVVISSTTETGFAAAKRLFAPAHAVFHWPLDFSWAVAWAMKRMNPAIVILMEGEAWPNFLAACNSRSIPAVIVNGRMSPNKGYPRYKKLGPLAEKLFNRLTAIGVQDESYGQSFRALGVTPDKIHLTGMMKYDTITVANHLPDQDRLATELGLDPHEPLLVAGGTGPGEETLLLDAYRELKKQTPNLRLALVPRKPERFHEVAQQIQNAGFELLRRSKTQGDTPPNTTAEAPVILGDTMGELRTFYAIASVVFVGRSLVRMGGSDMIEAAALGKAVCFGPHTFNFPQANALAKKGCVRVADINALTGQLAAWLANPQAATEAGQQAQQYVRRQQGATHRNVEMICQLLGRAPAVCNACIATDEIK